MVKLKAFFISLFFYSLAGFGISLTIRASIGVSSFNSLNVALSNAFQVKVGTITSLINLLFLFGYMVLSHFSRPAKYILQGISVLCFGMVINTFTYYFFPHFIPVNYFIKIILFVAGTILAGISTGIVVYFEAIVFPIEGFCLALSDRSKKPFATFRYLVDISCVIMSIILSVIFALPLYVREGTLISLLLLSSSIHLSREICQKKLGKSIYKI
jgi:uncharacterized protein